MGLTKREKKKEKLFLLYALQLRTILACDLLQNSFSLELKMPKMSHYSKTDKVELFATKKR